MHDESLQLTADATLEYIQGDILNALSILDQAIALNDTCFDAWLAKAEIFYSTRDLDSALAAAEKALEINSQSVLINTTLSRIWIERGDKKQAEHFSLQARRFGWKEYIQKGKRACKTL